MYSIRQYRNRIEIININTTDKRWNGGVMSIFTGAGVAIVTPMKANGEINYDKLAELLDYQINNSTDAIVICGTTGESATMTEKEHIEAIRFTADYVKKRVPVVAGTGSNCTKTAVELSKEAQAAGVDGCLVVTPYYNKATQKGLIEHYTAVARSIDLPIIMYNVPSRTGCNIQPETAVKLAREVDNIVAIKAATGNLSQESKTMMLAEGCLDMYSGEDGLIVPLMSIGAKGVISVLSNVAATFSVIPSASISSLTLALRILSISRKCFINAFLLAGPIPSISSRTELTCFLLLNDLWYSIANLCASS